ncbi:EAL domain-containing protein [Thalassotalea castellviae]|uniref:EAL domain-containing protein n=1 Tax=Thalassotalea castellviae TaxID=3075612 RepID=A0ABU2ZYI4_9GAMM|nr:EAL domain-containing protein [Thalassotalea sp. W431]MDT0602760.1 EAL domain-containing protein [Thalassotalea sp. W431]
MQFSFNSSAFFSRYLSSYISLLFLIFLGFSSSLFAAPANYDEKLKFKHITPANGLSQSYVFDIIQDEDGYIWLATQDGLNKYDGRKFKYYRSNILNDHSLTDNYIRKLYKDSQGNIWVGTQNGLSRYNKKLDNFDNFTFNESEENSLLDNTIWEIYEDQASETSNLDIPNNLWVATAKGLHKFDADNQRFIRTKIRQPSNNTSINLKEIKSIFHDKNGNYWFNSYDQGFFVTNKHLSLDHSLHKQIQSQLGSETSQINKILLIEKEYWLATNTGVYVLDERYTLKEHYTLAETGQTPLLARNIKMASDAHIWVATDSGLKSINPLTETSKSHSYTNIIDQEYNAYTYGLLVDNTDKLWVGTLNGVFVLSPESNIIHESKYIDEELKTNITAFVKEGDKIWFSSDDNLFQYTPHKKPLKIDIQLEGNITLLTKGDTHLFIVTDKFKLYKLNFKSNEITEELNWEEQSNHNGLNKLYYNQGKIWYVDNSQKLSNYDIQSEMFTSFSQLPFLFTNIHINNKNKIWLTSQDNKLYQFLTNKNKVEELNFKNESNFIIKNTSSINSSSFTIALGSNSQGLLVIDLINKTSQLYNEENLLSNNFVADIVIDSKNNLWISTNRGISSIQSENKIVTAYDNDHMLDNNEYLFQSSLIDKQGIIYFGTNSGFHYFSPDELLNSKQVINKPILSNLLIANKKIKIEENKQSKTYTLPEKLNNLSTIKLQYIHSPFSIEFISPNAKLPTQIGYKYKLNGVDENWLETDKDNLRATYTNLNAGTYRFEVQAFDIFDPNIFQSKSIDIKIMPPWWLSNSAVLIYTLIVLLFLAYLLQQFRHKRLYHLQIKASEERLKLSLWGSGDEMWDWNIKRGKIYRSNIWGILEFPQDGKRNLGNDGDNETNINQDDIAKITHALQEHFDDKTEHFEATYRVKDKDNHWIWVLDRGKIVERDDNNQPTRMTGTLKDISQIKKADERLKLFAKCIENISDAVVIYDRKFNIVDVNKSFQRITGKAKQQMIGKQMGFSRYPESFTRDVKKHLLNKGGWHGEIESKRDNGELYLTDLNIDIIRDENKSISHFVGVFSDITKRKETEAELRKLANSDTLTGLPNRSYFQANQARLVKNKVPHALLVFDLDNFKKVNDSMGHEVGDLLLCKVAKRIKNVGRNLDTVYRLGGDEFSLIIEDTNDIHTITTIAKNILSTIAQPLKLKNQEIVLYSSIGIVLYPEDGTSPQELLKNADTAMYHAKHIGGNQYQFFNGSMNKKAVKRLQIEGLIRHGLKEDYFSVFYQPKIEISTGKVAGMEALVRFETPSKGIISPVVFIPVSEETGQIIDIGETVLRKSCFATKQWLDAGLFDGRIAVNLSAVQFTQPNLVGMIESILKESQLPAKHLELEITEGTVMDSPQRAIETMLQIRAMGIHLSLDDFGTGYSSLAYLKKFPLNTLKIDKAFVDDIESSEQGRNMVATIVTIAHNLGLQVVAEGVETNQQLSFLSGLRCEQMQGYLYSKPLPEKDFRRYLLSHQITDKSTSFNKS